MIIATPIGNLEAIFDEEERLCELRFVNGRGFSPSMVPRAPGETALSATPQRGAKDALRQQLLEYFEGRRKSFDFALAPKGTPFQLAVWRALLEVPYGRTISYADLAQRIGKPSAVRAVGAANGANPIPVIIPCHRVIGSNGTLTGYGGGIERKQWLLALEGVRMF
jgi:methylated-DNA-[protein]-cysteine S-methyltransferase